MVKVLIGGRRTLPDWWMKSRWMKSWLPIAALTPTATRPPPVFPPVSPARFSTPAPAPAATPAPTPAATPTPTPTPISLLITKPIVLPDTHRVHARRAAPTVLEPLLGPIRLELRSVSPRGTIEAISRVAGGVYRLQASLKPPSMHLMGRGGTMRQVLSRTRIARLLRRLSRHISRHISPHVLVEYPREQHGCILVTARREVLVRTGELPLVRDRVVRPRVVEHLRERPAV